MRSPVERLYYTAKYPPIYVYCAHSLDKADSESGYLPQCVECKDKGVDCDTMCIVYSVCMVVFLVFKCLFILPCFSKCF